MLNSFIGAVVITILYVCSFASSTCSFRIIHTNDIHAHLDEFNNKNGQDCRLKDIESGNCVGGIARIRTMVDRIRSSNQNTLFFDAGDQFQGTLFYSYFKGEKIAEFMNDIKVSR